MTNIDDEEEEEEATSRVRQFPSNHIGPFTAFIRETDPNVQLKAVTLSKYIFSKYKSVTSVQSVSRVKMRVILSNLSEANMLVKDVTFKNYRAYLPAEEVEIQGIAQLSPDCTNTECTKYGKGKFKHPDIPSIPILETFRISKKKDPTSETSEVINTSYVRVTFPGKVIPDYVKLFGLLIRVKLNTRKAMFCDNCLQLNHTYCCNRPVSGRCTHKFSRPSLIQITLSMGYRKLIAERTVLSPVHRHRKTHSIMPHFLLLKGRARMLLLVTAHQAISHLRGIINPLRSKRNQLPRPLLPLHQDSQMVQHLQVLISTLKK